MSQRWVEPSVSRLGHYRTKSKLLNPAKTPSESSFLKGGLIGFQRIWTNDVAVHKVQNFMRESLRRRRRPVFEPPRPNPPGSQSASDQWARQSGPNGPAVPWAPILRLFHYNLIILDHQYPIFSSLWPGILRHLEKVDRQRVGVSEHTCRRTP